MGLHLGGSTIAQLNNAFARLSGVQTTRTTDGAIVAGSHNPVDATSGNRTVTLADAASAGLMVSVSKKDSTANTVTVSVAHLRDGAAGTITLVGQHEALTLTSKADGSWWPIGDHKTKAYFDATYAPTVLELMPAYIKGDSYASGGAGADNGTRFLDRLFSRLKTLTPSNTGVSGQTAAQILAGQVAGVWTPNSRGIIALADVVLNDARLNYSTATTAECFRSILTYLSSWYVGGISDTGVLFGTGWTSGTSDGTSGRYFDVSVNGDAAALLFTFGSSGGTVTVKAPVTGNALATANVSGYTTSFTGAVPVSGLGSGTHTVRVSVTGTVTFVGYAIPSPTPPGIIWYKPGTVTYAGDVGAGASGNRSAQLTACATIAALFSNVLAVDAGAGWDTSTMLAPDGMHPNDKGHAYIASTIEAAVRSSLTWRQGLNQLTAANAGTYTPAAPSYSITGASAPAAPSSVAGTTGNQVALTWTRSANDGGATITGQTVQSSPDGTTWTTVATLGAAVSSYTVTTGLTSGSSYVFRVGATNSVGTTYSTASASVTAGSAASGAADTFTRADNASSAGSTETGSYAWTTMNAQTVGAILSNQLKVTITVTNTEGILYIDPAVADCTIQITRVSGVDSGFSFRMSGTSDGYVFWGDVPNSRYELHRRTAPGVYTLVQAFTSGPVPANGDVLKVVMSGTSMTFYVNGTQVGTTVTDSVNNTKTKHGVWRGGTTTNVNLFDNFSLTIP